MRWKELMQQQDDFAAEIRKQDAIKFASNSFIKAFCNRLDPNIIHLYFDDGNSGGSVWMHLICGECGALLLDTGYGIGACGHPSELTQQKMAKELVAFIQALEKRTVIE